MSKKETVIAELESRGLVNQVTDEAISEHLESARTLYCGFDPTGDSLHVGHLLPIIVLKHFEKAGHNIIAVVGGATGLIGDPSGRSEERQLNTIETVEAYSENIRGQLVKYLEEGNTKFVNNYDWFSKLSAIDFLRDYGKSFGVNYMINKESVSSRLDKGLSYTEFSYTIIQALDFLHLYQNEGCTLEIGGSDQWGNITSGLELIRKNGDDSKEKKAFGLTVPLVTKSDGTKFGKTAGKAIWLNPDKTSPYEFYQFFLNTEDADVVKYLKYFTFLSLDEITELDEILQEKPFLRAPQRRLAEEVTRFVHGEEAVKTVQKMSEVLFSGELNKLSKEEIDVNFRSFGITDVSPGDLLLDVLVASGLASSKREGREFINAGAIKINGEVSKNVDLALEPAMGIGNTYVLVKRGKKKYALVRFQ